MKIRTLNILNNLGNKGIRESFIIEKRTGMPSKFKVPNVKIRWVRL